MTPSERPLITCARRVWCAVWLSALALILVPVRAGASAPPQPAVGPAPSWVAPPPAADPPSQGTAVGGQRLLLTERQVRVNGRSVEAYLHFEREVLDESGLQSASQVVIEFDPSYEAVEIHSVIVRRDGQSLDRLDRSSLKIVEREPNLEWQVFDGRLSIVLLVPDLRTHDVLSVSYTVRGSDPTLQGKYGETFALGGPEPVERMRVRLLVPAGTTLTVSVETPDKSLPDLQPTLQDLDGYRQYLWDRKHVAAAVEEANAPSWYIPVPVAALTEFHSWREVSQWGAELFRTGKTPPSLRQWVDETQKKASTVDDFILAAIRFVQDDVRYAAVEVGLARRRPNDPAVVFSRRYGDCKDKAALLTALLRAADIQARPAVVSTTLGRTLDHWPPHPGLLNHAIVRVTNAGTDYWVDATSTLQGGGLHRLRYSEFERALPLDEAGAEMTVLEPEPQSEVIEDEFRVDEPEAAALTTLDSRREYRGSKADRMRRAFGAATFEQLSAYFIGLYNRDFPMIRFYAPLEKADDRTENVIRVVAHFEIPNFWRWSDEVNQYKANWFARRVDEFVPTAAEGRSAPLAIPFPFHLHHVVKVTLPFDLAKYESQSTIDGPAFSFDFRERRSRRTWVNTYDLDTQRAVLGPADLEKHRSATAAVSQPTWGNLWSWPDGFNGWALAGLLPWALLLLWAGRRGYRVDMGLPATWLADAPPPKKIRGWAIVLLLFLLTTALAELRLAAIAVRATLSLRLWHGWISDAQGHPSWVGVARAVYMLFQTTGMAAYFSLLVTLLLKRRRSLRWQLAVAAAALLAMEMLDAYLFAEPGPISITARLELVGLGIRIALVALWTAYALRSKRFRETFVRDGRPHPGGGPPGAQGQV